MRPAAFFTGIGGMVVVVGLLMAGEARLTGASDGDDVAASALAPDPMTETPPPSPEPQQAMPDSQAEALAEAAAPAPPPETPAETPAPAKPAEGTAAKPDAKKSIDLQRPVVESAGILSFGERQLQLADIVPTPDDRTCGSGERQWPCGMIAKTQLRLFLRARTISCDLASAEWKGTATAACRLGAQDIGAWLAGNGWAEVAAGSPLVSDNARAKAGKLGLYGEDPRRKATPQPPDLPSVEIAPDPL
jgi:endonuclease YncB( thermonuclease family)